MSDYIIARVDTAKYELRRESGEIVESYEQTEMGHPTDWLDDAISDGGVEEDIRRGVWSYKDERD